MNLEPAGITSLKTLRTPNRTETPSIAIYWREQYRNEPYYSPEFAFTDYLPAYLLGSKNYNSECTFETAEAQLSHQWPEAKGRSGLRWTQARNAVRAGWYHTKRTSKAYGPMWVRDEVTH